MDQLAAMFCQLGRATAQLIRESTHTANEEEMASAAGAREKANADWREMEPAAALDLV